MKILNLIKCEFIKNYTIKRWTFILIILVLSIIVVTKYEEESKNSSLSDFNVYILNNYKKEYSTLMLNLNNDLMSEYELYNIEKKIYIYEMINDLSNSYNWHQDLIQEISILDKELFIIDSYLNNREKELLKYEEFIDYTNQIKKLSQNEIIEIKEEKNILRSKLFNLIKTNKFYQYLELKLELYELYKTDNKITFQHIDYLLDEESSVLFKQIVSEEIETPNNYFASNRLIRLKFNDNYEITNKWTSDTKLIKANYNKKIISILDYSINNNMKNDLTYNNWQGINNDYLYISSKTLVNQIFNLSVVIMFLVIITSGDIVSREHNLGTEKMLMTSPNKRGKILLSKFIYMILNMYIMWLFALILLSIYAGIKHGFIDLFTPKLIHFNGNVVEVNYYLYTIIKLFYVSIPVIALISIVFMLSTITLNTTITVGSTMAVSVISPFLWHFIQQFKLSLLAYTPIPYFMFSQVTNISENYLKVVDITHVSEGYGILISIITIIICYIVSYFVYVRRDVKN